MSVRIIGIYSIDKTIKVLEKRSDFYDKISKRNYENIIFQNYIKDVSINMVNKNGEKLVWLEHLKSEGFNYMIEIETLNTYIQLPMKNFDYDKGLIKVIEKEKK